MARATAPALPFISQPERTANSGPWPQAQIGLFLPASLAGSASSLRDSKTLRDAEVTIHQMLRGTVLVVRKTEIIVNSTDEVLFAAVNPRAIVENYRVEGVRVQRALDAQLFAAITTSDGPVVVVSHTHSARLIRISQHQGKITAETVKLQVASPEGKPRRLEVQETAEQTTHWGLYEPPFLRDFSPEASMAVTQALNKLVKHRYE